MSIYAKLRGSLTGYDRVLVLLFVLSSPFVNPWVRGDGVGYYAYIRSLLIHGDLHFEEEWLAGNPSFLMNRVDANGNLRPDQYTPTGYVGNHFTVGPAILWAPFLVVAHVLVLAFDDLGAHIATDGYSWPYTIAMAAATAFYGFLGLVLAFKFSRKYVEERWAFWGTLGIWFASSLPVYMYLNPSWSHAHSAFAVSAFLWYWDRTRHGERTYTQWAIQGALSGLMLNVYYPNVVFLLVPLLESLFRYHLIWGERPLNGLRLRRLFSADALYVVVVVVAFLPTLITRQVIFGHPLQFGYQSLRDWNWENPALWAVLFSSNHGMFTWTPILIPSVLGLLWLSRQDRELAAVLGIAFMGYYSLISSYPVWDGISSFGNRFFVSLTPVFVLGLSASLEAFSKLLQSRPAQLTIPAAVMLLVTWNLAFIFQWGTKLIPNRGPISWPQMFHNQVAVVPGKLFDTSTRYLLRRKSLMESLEREDVRQILAQKASNQRTKEK